MSDIRPTSSSKIKGRPKNASKRKATGTTGSRSHQAPKDVKCLIDVKDPSKGGYLLKIKNRSKATYDKRWFVLKEKKLYYFKSNKPTAEPHGMVPLDGYIPEIVDDRALMAKLKRSLTLFQLTHVTDRCFLLCAETEADMQDWVNAVIVEMFREFVVLKHVEASDDRVVSVVVLEEDKGVIPEITAAEISSHLDRSLRHSVRSLRFDDSVSAQDDFNADEFELYWDYTDEVSVARPVCEMFENCDNDNPAHWIEYQHTPPLDYFDTLEADKTADGEPCTSPKGAAPKGSMALPVSGTDGDDTGEEDPEVVRTRKLAEARRLKKEALEQKKKRLLPKTPPGGKQATDAATERQKALAEAKRLKAEALAKKRGATSRQTKEELEVEKTLESDLVLELKKNEGGVEEEGKKTAAAKEKVVAEEQQEEKEAAELKRREREVVERLKRLEEEEAEEAAEMAQEEEEAALKKRERAVAERLKKLEEEEAAALKADAVAQNAQQESDEKKNQENAESERKKALAEAKRLKGEMWAEKKLKQDAASKENDVAKSEAAKVELKRNVDQEVARKKGDEEDVVGKMREDEDAEKKKRQEEEAEKKKRGEEEAEKKKRQEEEAEKKKRQEEEAEKKKGGEEEAEKKMSEKRKEEKTKRDEEEAEKKKREEEEAEKKKRGEEEAEKNMREKRKEEKTKRDDEEVEKKKREDEEAEKKIRDEEACAERKKRVDTAAAAATKRDEELAEKKKREELQDKENKRRDVAAKRGHVISSALRPDGDGLLSAACASGTGSTRLGGASMSKRRVIRKGRRPPTRGASKLRPAVADNSKFCKEALAPGQAKGVLRLRRRGSGYGGSAAATIAEAPTPSGSRPAGARPMPVMGMGFGQIDFSSVTLKKNQAERKKKEAEAVPPEVLAFRKELNKLQTRFEGLSDEDILGGKGEQLNTEVARLKETLMTLRKSAPLHIRQDIPKFNTLSTALPKRVNEVFAAKAMSKSSNVCAVCNEPLKGRAIEAAGMQFHLDCFGCFDCGKKLESSCLNIGGKPYCDACGKKVFIQSRTR